MFTTYVNHNKGFYNANSVLSGEATNTNVIVFGLTQPGLEPTIYHTRGEHASHYATDAVDRLLISDYNHNSHLLPFTAMSEI
jgi:hypothetical protein